MRALGGWLGERTRQALAAGCDLALHCNGDPGEMEEVVAAARPISQLTAARLGRGEAMRCGSPPNGFVRKKSKPDSTSSLRAPAFRTLRSSEPGGRHGRNALSGEHLGSAGCL